MSKYFYIGADGQKQGPVSVQDLHLLANRRPIMSTTLLESETGHAGVAGQIPGLKFYPIPEQKPQETPIQQTSPVNFDFGFTRFFTNTWISFIWILTIIAHILGFSVCMVYVHSMSEESSGVSLVSLMIAVPLFLLSLLFSRMTLESIVVLFRIETHLRSIREHYENK